MARADVEGWAATPAWAAPWEEPAVTPWVTWEETPAEATAQIPETPVGTVAPSAAASTCRSAGRPDRMRLHRRAPTSAALATCPAMIAWIVSTGAFH